MKILHLRHASRLLDSSTCLKISYLQQESFKYHKGFAGLRPPPFPETVQYSIAIDPDKEVDWIESSGALINGAAASSADEDRPAATSVSGVVTAKRAEEELTQPQKPVHDNSAIPTPAPTSDAPAQTVLRQRPPSTYQTKPGTSLAMPREADASQLDDTLNTQSSNIPEMKEALRAMMQPEHITQGDTQTQWFPPSTHSEGTETSDLSDVSPLKDTAAPSPVRGAKLVLSQSVAKVLANAKPDLRRNAHQLATAGSKSKVASEVILCQCGHNEDEDDMVSCADTRSE